MTQTVYNDVSHLYTYEQHPYRDLYIYYIEGRLNSNVDIPGYCFIGNWEEDNFSFLFFSQQSDNVVNQLVKTHPHLTLLDNYHMTYDEWQGGSTDPVRAGGFVVAPPWEKKPEKSQKETYIALDPGVVFGTGTHPTTNDCLEAIEMVFRNNTVESAIDLGTGTGLLSLAIAKSGCKHVLAVDLNFLAARTTEKNIRLNQLENQVLAICGCATDFVSYPFDLVVANIHYDVMKHLINSNFFMDKKFFILSGLLRSETKKILEQLSTHEVTIIKKWDYKGIWHTYLVKNCF